MLLNPDDLKKPEEGSEPEQPGLNQESATGKSSPPPEFTPEADKNARSEAKSLKKKLKKKDHEIEHLKNGIEALKKEKDGLKDRYLRALAEMENQRKRLEREKNDFYQFALVELLKEILLVQDNFERALQTSNKTDGKTFHEGVELIFRQLQELLRKQGVAPIDVSDKKFDPSVHQAVSTEESGEVNDPVIGEVLQRGYRLNERLLRPVLVKVIVPKKS
jgi:molecular chaperone GrpE